MNTQATASGVQRITGTVILEVEYSHLTLANGDDVYLTQYGLPHLANLVPDSFWTDKAWFGDNHERLQGSSTLYRIRTKPVGGRHRDIVLKWNRMGQDVPGETLCDDPDGAEFNSPFEEFSLAMELRNTRYESPGRILTHKPLAIYVPAGRSELELLGRRRHKIEAKKDKHKDVQLDVQRNYAVIYEWIKGIDAAQAFAEDALDAEELAALVTRARNEMRWKGFRVRDSKAQHLIVRKARGSGLVADRQGQVLYASIDFELLERTPQREQSVRAAKRRTYLKRQARRFEASVTCPPNLQPVHVLGVDYIFGRVDSTGGALWVVGKDPTLFDYFLPEKWRRTPRTKLSLVTDTYETVTKDNIHLVWKVSRVGEQPDMDPFKADEKKILAYGYNSPFEEVSLNMALSRGGIPTTYPRAIYMTGSRSQVSALLADESRYRSHEDLGTPDGQPILRKGHDYIIIWGYWNGPDEVLAARDEDYCKAISAIQACRMGIVSEETYFQVMEKARGKLRAVGIEDLNLRGNHLLLSLDRSEQLMRDEDGVPTVRICNFELLRRTAP